MGLNAPANPYIPVNGIYVFSVTLITLSVTHLQASCYKGVSEVCQFEIGLQTVQTVQTAARGAVCEVILRHVMAARTKA